jgi:hypothetical protein
MLYKTTGFLVEELIIAQIEKNPDMKLISREEPAKHEVVSGVMISGRIDAIVEQDGKEVIWEIKSTSSRSALTKVINQGEVKVSQLGQLITYMTIKSIPRGVLSVTYVHFDRDITKVDFETRNFKVTTSLDGTIYIDGIRYKHSVVDLLTFYKVIADALTQPELPPKIANEKACLRCPFQKVCEKSPKVRDDFDRIGKELDDEINKQATPMSAEPKLNCHNIRG